MVFQNHDDVTREMQPILDSCAKKDNGIDGIAFLVGPSVECKSRVTGYGGDFDATLAPQLLNTFEETTQDKLGFNENTTLQYICFMNKDSKTGEMEVWTVATVFETYTLVFAGKFTNVKKLYIHQSSVPLYVERLFPLIKAYAELT